MELLFLEPQVHTQIKAAENIMLTVVIRLIGLLMLYRMNVEQNVNRKLDTTGAQVLYQDVVSKAYMHNAG